MEKIREDVFESAVEITSAALEAAEAKLDGEGGEQVGAFFAALCTGLSPAGEADERAFEGAVEITSAALEEAEAELSAEGGERVSAFFNALLPRLSAFAHEDEDVFEGAVEITSAALEEAEAELSAEGGEQAGAFFSAVCRRLGAAALGKDAPSAARRGCFEVYRDTAGEYRFRLKAANGEIVAVSEGYGSKDACLDGVDSVRRSALDAKIKEV